MRALALGQEAVRGRLLVDGSAAVGGVRDEAPEAREYVRAERLLPGFGEGQCNVHVGRPFHGSGIDLTMSSTISPIERIVLVDQ